MSARLNMIGMYSTFDNDGFRWEHFDNRWALSSDVQDIEISVRNEKNPFGDVHVEDRDISDMNVESVDEFLNRIPSVLTEAEKIEAEIDMMIAEEE